MSHKITIATLAPQTIAAPAGLDFEAARAAQLERWQALLARIEPEQPDLVVLPEACDRPQGYDSEAIAAYYEHVGTRNLEAFAAWCRTQRCYLAYSSLYYHEDGRMRNGTTLLGPDGAIVGRYHKHYLTLGESRECGIAHGAEPIVLDTPIGRLGFLICFDLNFLELLPRYQALRPDLLVFSSRYHGGFMQQFWAYHCQAHFVAAVAGQPSAILNPVGESLATTTNYQPYVAHEVNLDQVMVHLDHNRKKLEALKAHYGRAVRIHDPGRLGVVMVESRHGDTAREMIDAFEIEDWWSYYARSRDERQLPGRIEGGVGDGGD